MNYADGEREGVCVCVYVCVCVCVKWLENWKLEDPVNQCRQRSIKTLDVERSTL